MPPENVSLNVITSSSVGITWSPPAVESRNGIIGEYKINLLENDTGNQQNYVSYTTSFIIQSLHPYYTYHINVSAHTVLIGPYSEVQVIQMPEDGKLVVGKYIKLAFLCRKQDYFWG